jgi:hypothetical protein
MRDRIRGSNNVVRIADGSSSDDFDKRGRRKVTDYILGKFFVDVGYYNDDPKNLKISFIYPDKRDTITCNLGERFGTRNVYPPEFVGYLDSKCKNYGRICSFLKSMNIAEPCLANGRPVFLEVNNVRYDAWKFDMEKLKYLDNNGTLDYVICRKMVDNYPGWYPGQDESDGAKASVFDALDWESLDLIDEFAPKADDTDASDDSDTTYYEVSF